MKSIFFWNMMPCTVAEFTDFSRIHTLNMYGLLDAAHGYTLQFTITQRDTTHAHTRVHSHVFTAVSR
jgi:hypothetical protein